MRLHTYFHQISYTLWFYQSYLGFCGQSLIQCKLKELWDCCMQAIGLSTWVERIFPKVYFCWYEVLFPSHEIGSQLHLHSILCLEISFLSLLKTIHLFISLLVALTRTCFLLEDYWFFQLVQCSHVHYCPFGYLSLLDDRSSYLCKVGSLDLLNHMLFYNIL